MVFQISVQTSFVGKSYHIECQIIKPIFTDILKDKHRTSPHWEKSPDSIGGSFVIRGIIYKRSEQTLLCGNWYCKQAVSWGRKEESQKRAKEVRDKVKWHSNMPIS